MDVGGGARVTMTPKLRLREQARNKLLSWMRKLRLAGSWRTRIST